MKKIILHSHQFVQSLVSLLLVVIVLAIPSASLSDVHYYKALFTGYFKNIFCNYHL